MKRPEVKIVIPDILKLQLVDDWENVTKNNQVSDPWSAWARLICISWSRFPESQMSVIC
jgi:hypothetical protein